MNDHIRLHPLLQSNIWTWRVLCSIRRVQHGSPSFWKGDSSLYRAPESWTYLIFSFSPDSLLRGRRTRRRDNRWWSNVCGTQHWGTHRKMAICIARILCSGKWVSPARKRKNKVHSRTCKLPIVSTSSSKGIYRSGGWNVRTTKKCWSFWLVPWNDTFSVLLFVHFGMLCSWYNPQKR
jgi:hypothetical protein